MKGASLLLSAAMMLLFVACDDDAPSGKQQKENTLGLLVSMKDYQEVLMTRANTEFPLLPDNYVPFETLYPTPRIGSSDIGVFMTYGTSVDKGKFYYDAETGRWDSDVPVVKDRQYYIYGVMPAYLAPDKDNVHPVTSDFSGGATMTMVVNAVTASDVCIIVGVRDVDAATEIISHNIADYGCDLGSFGYLGKDTHNYVTILLDHLYSCVNFEFAMGNKNVPDGTGTDPRDVRYDASGYADLRTIKIKKVTVRASSSEGGGTYTVTARVKPLATGETQETWQPEITWSKGAGSDVSAVIYEGEGLTVPDKIEGFTSKPYKNGYLSIPGYFVPGGNGESGAASTTTYTIETEYDVYDKKGNLIRSGCKAQNTWSPGEEDLMKERRKCYTIRIILKPTYLYQLADPDLDNPSFEIS